MNDDVLIPREVVERLIAKFDGDCRLDHDGFCQQHYFGEPCVIPILAARLLEKEPDL